MRGLRFIASRPLPWGAGRTNNAHRYHRTFPVTNATAQNPADPIAVRSDPAARRVVREWRRLTAPSECAAAVGGRTLVACSAGADSTALLLILAGATDNLVAAYIRHDMRPPAQTDLDLAFVRELAASLGVTFVTRDVSLEPGNPEAQARRARYAALTDLALEHACPFVAVAHHADDLLETQLMALLRGASLRGLASLRPRRRLSSRVTLIRPMLALTRDDAMRICAGAGVRPIQDATNLDTDRLRAALRAGVLGGLAPRAARRAHQTAALMRDAHALIAERAREVRADQGAWCRDTLAAQRTVVIIEAIRAEFRRQTLGVGLDALSSRALAPVVRAIRDESNEPRVFPLPSGVRIEVGERRVRMVRAKGGSVRG